MPTPREGYERFWVGEIPKHVMRVLEKIRVKQGKFKKSMIVAMANEYIDKHKHVLSGEGEQE